MDQLKTLPTPLKFGIPILAVLVLGGLVWTLFLRPPEMSVVYRTANAEEYEYAIAVLGQESVAFDSTLDRDTGLYKVLVEESTRTEAETALEGAQLLRRMETTEIKECGDSPGMTATKDTARNYYDCEASRKAQQYLMQQTGVLGATVEVDSIESSQTFGPDSYRTVVATVFLRDDFKDRLDYDVLAKGVASAAGTEIEHVLLTDDESNALYEAGREGGGAASASSMPVSVSSADECAGLTGFTDIEEKRQAVQGCYRDQLTKEIGSMVGGADNVRVITMVDIRSEQVTETTDKVLEGPNASSSSNRGGGSVVESVTNENGSTSTTRTLMPGAVTALHVTALLNRGDATKFQAKLVKSMLVGYTSVFPDSPSPQVSLAKLTSQEPVDLGELDPLIGGSAGAPVDGVGSDPAGVDALDQDSEETGSSASTALLAIGSVLVIGLLTAIAILWRRSTRMAADRRRYEEEFRNEQRLLDDFARANPDDIARDLEALLGPPATREEVRS